MELRKDVEGLRAVAILLVVAAHAGAPGLAGGFVGVDVFFVLSGFLITGLLVSAHARAGRVDFWTFYSRRFRRLLPALAVMLLATAWLAAQLIPVNQQAGHAGSGIAAAFWLSNMHFVLSATDYFTAHHDLYLHTWSLGVEEQFYLIWPMLVAAALAGGGPSPQRLRLMMLGITVASGIACMVVSRSSALLAFYLMPLRAWQFALGALVWLLFASRSRNACPPSTEHAWPAAIAAGSGLALILSAALLVDGSVRYPGYWSLMPTLGTCLVLYAGSIAVQTSLPMLLLRTVPMQWLGRMSYGWYLWHWPLLVLGASVFDMGDGRVRLALVLAALAVAWLSFHLVEYPIRHARRWPFTPRRTVLLSLAVMAGVATVGLKWMAGAAEANAEWQSTRRITLPEIYGMDCDRWYRDAELTPCVFDPASGAPGAVVAVVAVVGDSIGLQWFPALSALARRHGWRLVVLTKSACAMVDEPIYYARIGREYTECMQWRDAALSHVATLQPDAVILGSSASYEFGAGQWTEGTRRVLARLSDKVSAGIAILRPTPELPVSGDTCVDFHTPLRDWLMQESRCESSAHDPQRDRVASYLQDAASTFANVRLIDMTSAICPGGMCRAERDGLLVYRDTQHLNAAFVEGLVDPLETSLREALPSLF